MIGRHRPVGIESAQFQPFRLHFLGQITEEAYQILDGHVNHEDSEQVRKVVEYSGKNALHRIPDVGKQPVGQVLSLRENGEQQRNRKQQLQEHKRITYQIGQEYQQFHLLPGVQQLIPLNGEGFQPRFFQSHNTQFQLTEHPVGSPEQEELSHKHQHEITNPLEQLHQPVLFLHHFQFFDNNQPILRGQLVACTAFPQAVLVCKGNKDFIIIHYIRHDVTGLNVYRIRLQVKAFAQGRNIIRHVLCTLLGSMSPPRLA